MDFEPKTIEDLRNIRVGELSEEQMAEVRKRGEACLREITDKIDNPLVMLLGLNDIFTWVKDRCIAEVLGIENASTEHEHVCAKDGTVWRHDPATTYFLMNNKPYEESHKCPTCGEPEYIAQVKLHGQIISTDGLEKSKNNS